MNAVAEKLPESMSAVVCHAPKDYRLEERSVPKPGPEEVLIKVKSTGICASDIKCYAGAERYWGHKNRPRYCQAPVTPGHEFAGEVVALGEGAGEKYGLTIGDHAVSEQIVPCWKCEYCKMGAYWMCAVHDIYGFRQRTFGAWAQYMLLPRGALNYKVPASLPWHYAAFIEPRLPERD
jgi:threonine dehydrogenase-like Zn-dependent dehydrogenase